MTCSTDCVESSESVKLESSESSPPPMTAHKILLCLCAVPLDKQTSLPDESATRKARIQRFWIFLPVPSSRHKPNRRQSINRNRNPTQNKTCPSLPQPQPWPRPSVSPSAHIVCRIFSPISFRYVCMRRDWWQSADQSELVVAARRYLIQSNEKDSWLLLELRAPVSSACIYHVESTDLSTHIRVLFRTCNVT